MEWYVDPKLYCAGLILLIGFAACAILSLLLLQSLIKVGPKDAAEQEMDEDATALQETRAETGEAGSTFEADLQRAKVYEISLPKGTSWDPDRAKSFLEHMLDLFRVRAVLRIVAERGRVVWQMIDCFTRLEETRMVMQAVRSMYPEAEVRVSNYQSRPVTGPFDRAVLPWKLENSFFAPMKSVMEIKGSDPLATFVHSLADLQEGERFVYTLCFAGFCDAERIKSERQKIVQSGWGLFALGMLKAVAKAPGEVSSGVGRTGRGKYSPEEQALFEHKLYDQSLFDVYLLLQKDAVGEDRESLTHMVNSGAILRTQLGSDYNRLDILFDEGTDLVDWVDSPEKERSTSSMGVIGGLVGKTDPHWAQARAVLSTEEIAALWHLPHDGFQSTAIVWTPTRRPAPAALVSSQAGVLLGHNLVAGSRNAIRLRDDDRDTHINIVGKTKVGKSTLMHNLIHQDIQAGKGVGVVDPHGNLVRDILRHSIPDERMDDVVLIDVANEEHPAPLNPMRVPGKRGRLAAGRVLAVLDKIYGGFTGTPRIADTLQAALVTLWLEEAPTVRDVTRLFEDLEYRYSLLNQLDDLVTEEFWSRFGNLSPSRQDELSYPVIYRMRNFYGNPTLYPVLCHPDALDLAGLISSGKIILVSLRANEEKIPPREQRLLGAVIVSQLQMAVMKLAEKESPEAEAVGVVGKKPAFYLYIDEAQQLVTTALDEMFAEARKFGLSLTVAHQFLGQLRGRTLEAVMGNVGTSIVFQVGPNDARVLAAYFAPEFKGQDLMNLDLYHAAVKMRLGGKTLPAFGLETRPGPGAEEDAGAEEREQIIRKRSIEQYTPKTREEVLGWLEKRFTKPSFVLPREERNRRRSEDVNWVVTPEAGE